MQTWYCAYPHPTVPPPRTTPRKPSHRQRQVELWATWSGLSTPLGSDFKWKYTCRTCRQSQQEDQTIEVDPPCTLHPPPPWAWLYLAGEVPCEDLLCHPLSPSHLPIRMPASLSRFRSAGSRQGKNLVPGPPMPSRRCAHLEHFSGKIQRREHWRRNQDDANKLPDRRVEAI